MEQLRVMKSVQFVFVLVSVFMLSFAAYAATEDIAVVQDNSNIILSNPKGGATTMQNATKEFYKTHDDEFDFLFVFQQVNTNMFQDEEYLPGAYATSKAPNGTGAPSPAYTAASFGSAGKLKSVGDMYSVNNYTALPSDPYIHTILVGGLDKAESGYSQTCMVARATMKYWGSYLLPNGITGGNGWYSYYFNSMNSVLGGHYMQSQYDENTYKGQVSVGKRLSKLDLYTMGLISKDDVTSGDDPHELFYLTGDTKHSASDLPGDSSVYFEDVTRVDVTMDQIVSANGAINMENAQKEFKCAFILVVPAGTSAMSADVSKLDKLRASFQTWFYTQTDKLGSMDCKLSDVADDGDTDKLCEDGDYACDEYVLMVCQDEKWVFVENCNNKGLYCSKTKGECVEDLDDVDGDSTTDNCTDGDTRCNGTVIELCASGSWTYNTDCANTKEVCYDATCMDESQVPDGDESQTDGDVTTDGDSVITDGDSDAGDNSCVLHTDCPTGQRCTSQGCMPCPTGSTFDILSGNCVASSSADGGGGCNTTHSASMILILFALALIARRKMARNN